MPTFLLERVIPPAFDVHSPDAVALHSRWAADAYAAAGIVWLGGIATGSGTMFSVVVADGKEDIERYRASLGIAPADLRIHDVVTTIGPHAAMARSDPRYRPPRLP